MERASTVAVVAATHNLGQALVKILEPNFRIRVLGRSLDSLQNVFPNHSGKAQLDFTRPKTIKPALEGCDIVVNIAHARYVPMLLQNLPASVKKIISIGSTWKFTHFPNERAEQVREAEELLTKSNLEWVMLHPSMIYGMPEEKTVSRLVSWVSKFPIVPLPNGGKSLVQPIHADDIVAALVEAVQNPQMSNNSYILAAHQPITYKEMVKLCAKKVGRTAWVISIPKGLLKFVVKTLSFTTLREKLREDQIDRLTEDKNFDVSPIENVLGRELLSFSDGLKQTTIGEL